MITFLFVWSSVFHDKSVEANKCLLQLYAKYLRLSFADPSVEHLENQLLIILQISEIPKFAKRSIFSLLGCCVYDVNWFCPVHFPLK